VAEITAEGENAVGLQSAAGLTAQVLIDGGGRLPLATALVVDGLEILVEVLHGGRQELKLAVVCHDGLDLVGREPPLLLMVHDEGVSLTVEPLVVGFIAGVDGGRQLHADEAAVAGGIAQHAALIGGGDERGVALELLDMLAVGALDLHAGQLTKPRAMRTGPASRK